MTKLDSKQEQRLKSFIRPMVDHGEDWQFIAVEAIEHFAWLTSSDEDWEYVVGIVTDIEREA